MTAAPLSAEVPADGQSHSDDPYQQPSDVGPSWAARLATYDSLAAAPLVEDVGCDTPAGLIELLSAKVHSVARDRGGQLPYMAVREVVENLVHASFREVVVSVLDGGNTLRFADHGPGIPDKERAFLPGFSTATEEMRSLIRGVGSGLPIVKECVAVGGGQIAVDDNIGGGTVVTLRAGGIDPSEAHSQDLPADMEPPLPIPPLGVRQKQVLSLIMELGEAGPSLVAKELKVGLSTAYRDLAFLEEAGLVVSDIFGKRALSPSGRKLLEASFGGMS